MKLRCQWCGKAFDSYRKGRKFCCLDCHYKHASKKHNPEGYNRRPDLSELNRHLNPTRMTDDVKAKLTLINLGSGEEKSYVKLNGRHLHRTIAEMKLEIKRLDRALTKLDSREITDDQIATARAYPIDRLIKFHRGKATAPCHEDRNPSMYHGTRKNVAVCPVCDKKWGPIDWLMEIEGKTFVEAVRELAA